MKKNKQGTKKEKEIFRESPPFPLPLFFRKKKNESRRKRIVSPFKEEKRKGKEEEKEEKKRKEKQKKLPRRTALCGVFSWIQR